MKAAFESGNVRDALVAVLCVTAIAATGYSLYLDGATRLEAGDAAPAGQIDFRSGDTHRRYADRALWERLDAGDIVYNRNSIRTGDGDSGASIRLNDDTRIELDQATMIVLQINENEIRLQLKAGSLEIRRSRPRYQQPLTVGRGDHVLELDSGEVRLESTKDPGMHVTPLLGSVTVRESSRRIRTGDQITLSNSGRSLRQLGIVLLSPAQGERIAAAAQADRTDPALTPVRLAWKLRGTDSDSDDESQNVSAGADNKVATSADANANEATATVDISRDPEFQAIVSSSELLSTSGTTRRAIELQLSAGLYYWRVRQAAERSATGKFRIVPAPAAVQIISPAPGGEIRVASASSDAGNGAVQGEHHDVQFAWSPRSSASHYRLEIFRGSDESALRRVVSKKVERDYVRVRLAPGEYRFRVHSFAANESGSNQSSNLARFRLVQASASPGPVSTPESNPESVPDLATRAKPAPLQRADLSREAPASAKAPNNPATVATIQSTPLRLLYPTRGATVDMANKTAIVFRWRPARDAAGQPHRVRFIDLTRGAGRVLFETTTTATSASFARLQDLEHNGRYRWSVTPVTTANIAKTGATAAAQTAGDAEFRVILSQQPEQPQFLSSSDEANQ